ncbi:MAG TPA: O-linked N-acetylglucosamine transferase, SPINDLY family protein [Coleofasciculaceae cyanobacterium]|jgi:predicted O-linked N-acetylglucosamine transferase (SPINDLY family)
MNSDPSISLDFAHPEQQNPLQADEDLLQRLRLALATEPFEMEAGLLRQVNDRLEQILTLGFSLEDLLQIGQRLIQADPGQEATWTFLELCRPHWSEAQISALLRQLLAVAKAIAHHASSNSAAQKIVSRLDHLSLQLAADDVRVLFLILYRLQHGSSTDRLESVALAERCLHLSTQWSDRITATNILLLSWLQNGGNWQRAAEIYQNYKALLRSFLQAYEANPEAENLESLTHLLPVGALSFYFEDDPQHNRPFRHQIAQIGQVHLQAELSQNVERYRAANQARSPLASASRRKVPRIGYLSECLQQHSVGWLARWLLKYHDRNQFEIHLYSPRPSKDRIQNQLRLDYGDRFHDLPASIAQMADRIYDDQIDILVELDSLTCLGGCGVMALKPAPIQVHWLGYDASGIPGVDYFIVDPYVLPEDAQDYYSETLWRMPHSYIAVDGFETHPPTLRRDQIDIPADAIVYLSSQTGLKRNLDNARLQMQVIKAVPQSYFLIKSFQANPEYVESFFRELAESEGVSSDRLRFLPDVTSEALHRANMAIADVVLDTYPYNGATTTLEALWLGLPIVTRVGQQFAARNSYTMMMNVGIPEGISWNNDEYLEWAIRLGTDAALRQDIAYRLNRSRHTSPLWNGQQFARDMESAYQQMWEKY